ncbi:MAG TPA: hypothetical protein VIL30_25880 [Ramlibacter sp.]|jgi:hypothetical protein
MNRFARGSIVLLLSIVGAAAGAQSVHRCGDGRTYTDKPCEGATAVDLRANILDAGPRDAGRSEPAPAIILPDTSTTIRQGPATSAGSAWDRKHERDAAHERRTYSR